MNLDLNYIGKGSIGSSGYQGDSPHIVYCSGLFFCRNIDVISFSIPDTWGKFPRNIILLS